MIDMAATFAAAERAFAGGDAQTAVRLIGQIEPLIAPDPAVLHLKALALKRAGRSEEARLAFEQAHKLAPRDPQIANNHANLLKQMGRYEEAEAAYDKALRLEPRQAAALAGRARLALERGDQDAVERYEAALRARPNDRPTILGLAEALEARGDARCVELLERAVRAQPDWLTGLETLARMRGEVGEENFTRDMRAALGRGGDDRALRLSMARMLAAADRYEAALAALPSDDAPDLAVTRAFYLGESGRPEEGLAALESAALPQTTDVALIRGRLNMRLGALDQAAIALEEAVRLAPSSISAWGHLELVWRATGDGRALWLSGQQGLYSARDIGLTEPELAETAALLRSLHRTRAHPIGQSLRGGTQTRGRLLLRREPEIKRLFAALQDAVEAHRSALPPADPSHPLLSHRDQPLRIAGSWSVRLTGAGFHVSHVHPQGLLSSACYLAVPEGIDRSSSQEGWLELGRPPRELGMELAPLTAIAPKPGRLALFPSYLYHGTRPFADGERLTVAFDVVAA